MERFTFSYRLWDIFNPIYAYFETFFSTVKTEYFNSLSNGLLALGTDHFFASLFKAGNMEMVGAGSDHHRPVGSAYIAFFFLKLIGPPFNIVLEYEEGGTFIAAAEMFRAEPDGKCQQSHCYQHHRYFISYIPTTKPVFALYYLSAASLLYLLHAASLNYDKPQHFW